MARVHRVATWWRAHEALGAAVIYAVLSHGLRRTGSLPGRTLSNCGLPLQRRAVDGFQPAGVRFGGANFELADATAVFLPFFDYAAPRCLTCRCGTRTSWPAARSWPTRSRDVLAVQRRRCSCLPVWHALAVIAVLKLFVAAFGTYLFGRALGMRFGGALLAGQVFAFGTFFVVWLGWPLTNVFSLLPWLLLFTEALVSAARDRCPSPGWRR